VKYKLLLVILILLSTLFRIYYIEWGPLDLAPDEAHYWEWSRRLDLSYYSKGPVIAYIIAFFTSIFGNSELGVRIGAVIISSLLTVVVFSFTRRLFKSERPAFFAALIPHITPLFAAGSILMTTDSPLILFWGLSINTFFEALENKKSAYWLLSGILIGLGFLSKYTMALLYPSLFLFLFFSGNDRVWLWRKDPYLMILASLVIVSPIFLWNSQNDWVGFRHVAGQSHIMEGWELSSKYFFDFLASQSGILSPLIFIGLLFSMIKTGVEGLKGRREYLLLFLTSAPVFLFFLIKSVQGKVLGNWAAPAYVTGFIALVAVFDSIYQKNLQSITILDKKKKKVLKSRIVIFLSLALGLLFTIVTHYPGSLTYLGADIPPRMNPATKLKGWEELGKAVGVIYNDMQKKGNAFILSDQYQIASELAFYVPGNPITYNINLGRRMNQYDIWGDLNALKGFDAVYVKGGSSPLLGVLRNTFRACEERVPLKIQRGERIIREFSIYKCYSFKGVEQSPFTNW
jgi:4-amino-4-deoxy-L-arabinose transferase-like glycosyltransferase